MTRSVLISGPLRLAALVLLLGAGACGYENPNQPGIVIIDPTAPFQVTIGALPGTGAQAGTAAVTARVQNANGAALADVVVTFTTNRGTIAPTSVATGADGAASTTLAATDTADVTAAVGRRLSAHTLVAPVPPTAPLPAPTPAPGPSPSPTPPPPAVFLNVPANATAGVAVVFNVSSSATGVTWNWSFGDGETAQTTAFSTTHIYASAGTYSAAVSAAGTSSASATVTVVPPPVVAPPTPPSGSYTVTLSAAPPSVVAGGSATLTAGVALVNGAPTPTLYAWDCDNNNTIDFTSSTPSATCTYLTAGNATAKVTVTGGSATGSATTTVTVTAPPTPSYSVTLSAAPQSVMAGSSAILTAGVTLVNGAPTPTLYAWDCDNNNTIDFTSSTPSATCTYLTAGNVTGKVTVTGGSATGSATTTVTVTAPPTPSYTVTLSAAPSTVSVAAGGRTTLTAGVTLVNGAPTPTLYAWDCDNNNTIDFTSSTNSATCTYLTAGNVTGKVTVTGGSATGSATTTVTVTP